MLLCQTHQWQVSSGCLDLTSGWHCLDLQSVTLTFDHTNELIWNALTRDGFVCISVFYMDVLIIYLTFYFVEPPMATSDASPNNASGFSLTSASSAAANSPANKRRSSSFRSVCPSVSLSACQLVCLLFCLYATIPMLLYLYCVPAYHFPIFADPPPTPSPNTISPPTPTEPDHVTEYYRIWDFTRFVMGFPTNSVKNGKIS